VPCTPRALYTNTHLAAPHTRTRTLYRKPAVKASPAPVVSTTSSLNTGTKPVPCVGVCWRVVRLVVHGCCLGQVSAHAATHQQRCAQRPVNIATDPPQPPHPHPHQAALRAQHTHLCARPWCSCSSRRHPRHPPSPAPQAHWAACQRPVCCVRHHHQRHGAIALLRHMTQHTRRASACVRRTSCWARPAAVAVSLSHGTPVGPLLSHKHRWCEMSTACVTPSHDHSSRSPRTG
jgi:hypothetical protein